jgi:hypothetical protein
MPRWFACIDCDVALCTSSCTAWDDPFDPYRSFSAMQFDPRQLRHCGLWDAEDLLMWVDHRLEENGGGNDREELIQIRNRCLADLEAERTGAEHLRRIQQQSDSLPE